MPSPIRSLSQMPEVVMHVLMALVRCVANGPFKIHTFIGMNTSFAKPRFTVSEPPVHVTGVLMAGGRKLSNARTSSLPPDADTCSPKSTVSVVEVDLLYANTPAPSRPFASTPRSEPEVLLSTTFALHPMRSAHRLMLTITANFSEICIDRPPAITGAHLAGCHEVRPRGWPMHSSAALWHI